MYFMKEAGRHYREIKESEMWRVNQIIVVIDASAMLKENVQKLIGLVSAKECVHDDETFLSVGGIL